MKQTLNFIVPAAMGVESLTAYELKKLGLADVRSENGRVLCIGSPADIPRVNINLRTGARLLIALGSFPARTFEELFQGASALPWEDYIPREGRFPVKGWSIGSQLHAIPACQSILKKALAKRLGSVYGLNTLPETGALYQVQFSILKNQVTLMLDTTGENLYKRGYRAQGVAAPLRETLGRRRWYLSPATRAKTPSATPSAARAPFPLRRPSSPRTGPPA